LRARAPRPETVRRAGGHPPCPTAAAR
jgi:hypothetical protein